MQICSGQLDLSLSLIERFRPQTGRSSLYAYTSKSILKGWPYIIAGTMEVSDMIR